MILPSKSGGGSIRSIIIDNNGSDFSSDYARTIDVSQYLPNDYQNLTIDNFSLANSAITTASGGTSNSYDSILGTYNPSTGMLNCNVSNIYRQGTGRFFILYKIKVTY